MKPTILRAILIISAIIYVLAGIALWTFQERFIFFPSDEILPVPNSFLTDEVQIRTEDDALLFGWYTDVGADRTVLFFHGNAGNVSNRTLQLEYFQKLGLNSLMVDYRGYGNSEGRIRQEKDLYRDAEASYEYLVEIQGIPEEDIIIWGRSLGGAVAIDIAQNKPVQAVIIESSFSSMTAMARRQFGIFPVSLLLRYLMRSDQKIGNISSDILVIHSLDDEVIPYEMGRALYDQSNEPKEFLEIQGDHNSGFFVSEDIYLNAIQEFIEKDQ